MKLGLIECGHTRDAWREHGTFGAWFPPLLALAGAGLAYETFNAVDGVLPGPTRRCDAYLLTGSPASAYDGETWQLALSDFLAPLVGQVPLVGICYGHQHLHHMLGGQVEKTSDWGVGVQHYDVTTIPEWLPGDVAGDSAQGFDLIALHQDQVTRCAPGSRVLASGPACPAAVTVIGARVLTFQPHPEMQPAFAAEVYRFEEHRIGPDPTKAALASLSTPRNAELAARWIMAFLTHHCSPKEPRP